MRALAVTRTAHNDRSAETSSYACKLILTYILTLVAPAALLATPGSAQNSQEDDRCAYLGSWEYVGRLVHFTFMLSPDGTGYLADEINTYPFRYVLDVESDPARLDLFYEVDMAFGRTSHTLVRLERTDAGERLHWVSMPTESGPPEWPETASQTPRGVTWLTFERVESQLCESRKSLVRPNTRMQQTARLALTRKVVDL